MVRSKKIRQAARGEDCTVQILGVCNDNPETTVLAHLPDYQGGMAYKASDLSSAFACSDCHDAIDRRVKSEELESTRDWYLRRAQLRTLERLVEIGLVIIK